jgi:hypothetical protein
MTFEERSKLGLEQLSKQKPVTLEDARNQVQKLKGLMSFEQFMAESVKDGVVTCDNCGWKWDLSAGGNDPYTCHKCGEDTSTTEKQTYTAKEIVDYVTQISDTPEADVPDYYFDLILKAGAKFVKKTLKIADLLAKDKSLEEYVKSGEDRYEDSDYEPSHKELENPVVIYKGEVIDGYNRISTKYRNDEKEVEAYVSI